jgi:hypothetical protein
MESARKLVTVMVLALSVPPDIRVAERLPVLILLALRLVTLHRLAFSVPVVSTLPETPVPTIAPFSVPVVMFVALRLVIVTLVPFRVPVVILPAFRLVTFTRLAFSVPAVILSALRLGILAAVQVPANVVVA